VDVPFMLQLTKLLHSLSSPGLDNYSQPQCPSLLGNITHNVFGCPALSAILLNDAGQQKNSQSMVSNRHKPQGFMVASQQRLLYPMATVTRSGCSSSHQ